ALAYATTSSYGCCTLDRQLGLRPTSPVDAAGTSTRPRTFPLVQVGTLMLATYLGGVAFGSRDPQARCLRCGDGRLPGVRIRIRPEPGGERRPRHRRWRHGIRRAVEQRLK